MTWCFTFGSSFPLRLTAALTDTRSVRIYLEGVGLDVRAPPITPAHLEPQFGSGDAPGHVAVMRA